MPQTARARAAGPAGRRAVPRGRAEQGRRGRRPGAARPGRAGGPRAARRVRLPGRRACRSYGCPALRALEGDPRWTQSIVRRCSTRSTRYVPVPPRELDEPFLMPIENVLTITGRGTVVTGAVERGTLRRRRPGRGRRARPDAGHRGHRAGDVRQADGARPRPATTRRCCCAASSATQVRRGQVVAAPGSVTPHRRFTARGVRADHGGGRPAHAVRRRTTGRSSTSGPRTSSGAVDLGEADRWSCRATPST